MTISSTTRFNTYTGTSATATYAYTPWRIMDQTHLKVSVQHPTTFAWTLLTLTTDYTVTGVGNGTGGNVVLVDASQAWLTGGYLTTSWVIYIERVVPNTQLTNVRGEGPYKPEIHEDEFDLLVSADQALQALADRSLKLPLGETPSVALTTIPSNADRASKVLGFDSSGNPIALSSVTTGVTASTYWQSVLTASTAAASRLLLGTSSQVFNARLTLASGTPVTTTDQTAKTSVYLTPYGGNGVALYDGSMWVIRPLTEITIPVPSVASTMHDVFLAYVAGAFTTEILAWTNDTTRAAALINFEGVLVKTGTSGMYRYVGSFRTTGSVGQTEDSLAKRYVWNYYNRVTRPMFVKEGTASWTYTTAAWRQANAAATNQLDMVIGVSEDPVSAEVVALGKNGAGNVSFVVGIGVDSTSAINTSGSLLEYVTPPGAAETVPLFATYKGFPGEGRHYIAWLEYSVASNTTTWYGSGTGLAQSGIIGELRG